MRFRLLALLAIMGCLAAAAPAAPEAAAASAPDAATASLPVSTAASPATAAAASPETATAASLPASAVAGWEPTAAAGSPPDAAASYADNAGTATHVLRLSVALEQAAAQGPGFAAAALQERLRVLAEEANAVRGRPALTLTSWTELHPEIGHVLSGAATWQVDEHLAFDASFSVAPEFGGRLTAGFRRALWPPAPRDLAEEERALTTAIVRRRADDEAFDAALDVIRAFYALRDAQFGVLVAEQALSVASLRAAIAEDRFAAGELGLAEWQAAQRAQRQAQFDVRAARIAHRQAAERLARLMAAAGQPAAGGQVLLDGSFQELVDDLPWPAVQAAVEHVLAEAEDALGGRFLANDTAYLEAVRAELEQALAAADAERATRVNWQAVIEYTLPFGSSDAGGGSFAPGSAAGGSGAGGGSSPSSGTGPGSGLEADPNPGPGAGSNFGSGTGTTSTGPLLSPAGRGELAVYLVAALDLSGAGRVRHQQAQTSLELARLRTEQARHAALDAGLAAVRTAENAAFALELANEAVEQAQDTMALVQRRTVLGFAPPLELEEARLELLRARRDAARAEAELHLAWLELARRLGIAPRWP